MPSNPFKIGAESISLPVEGWISRQELANYENDLSENTIQGLLDRLDSAISYRKIILTNTLKKKSRIIKIV